MVNNNNYYYVYIYIYRRAYSRDWSDECRGKMNTSRNAKTGGWQ